MSAETLAVNASSLPPVDEGFGAWSFLCAAFFVEAVVWGFPHAFGVFLDAYLQDEVYSTQPNAASLLPLIGNLAWGIMYCGGVVVQPLLARFPQYKRLNLLVGTLICFGSLYGASYVLQVRYLVILQGTLYAIGGSMVYAPCISYMPEWFVKKRGLANGVIFSGAAVGGAVFPLIISALLARYSVQKSLQILSFSMTAVLLPFLPFLKGRLPTTRVVGPGTRSAGSKAWLHDRLFWMGLAANTVQSLGHFVPMTWLPTFATELRVGPTKASVVLTVLNGAACVGQAAIGILSDRYDPWMLAIVNLGITCVATFLVWGVFSYSYTALLIYGLTYGIFAGGWSSLWTGFIGPVAKDDHILAATLLSYLLFSRGIGNIVSTQIITTIMPQNGNSTMAGGHVRPSKLGFDVADGRFKNMIMYVGTCFAVGSIIIVAGWAKGKWKRGGAIAS
ncbi:MFS general substrate transporter [Pterulicium gracile]|uniref:MFS general substrate transporter n=1 Tax=Pterulicium gracile TaxID=1884261 RepID=A0A5C3Q7Q4_9AGAR|nr:MFS general substrate transporter [Pterula gracilis]